MLTVLISPSLHTIHLVSQILPQIPMLLIVSQPLLILLAFLYAFLALALLYTLHSLMWKRTTVKRMASAESVAALTIEKQIAPSILLKLSMKNTLRNKNLNYHNYRNFRQLQATIITAFGNNSCLKLLEVAIVIERRKIAEVWSS